jgi:hypothetical protein
MDLGITPWRLSLGDEASKEPAVAGYELVDRIQ